MGSSGMCTHATNLGEEQMVASPWWQAQLRWYQTWESFAIYILPQLVTGQRLVCTNALRGFAKCLTLIVRTPKRNMKAAPRYWPMGRLLFITSGKLLKAAPIPTLMTVINPRAVDEPMRLRHLPTCIQAIVEILQRENNQFPRSVL